MRERRVLFMACVTAGTLAGAAAGAHAMATSVGGPIVDLSEANLRDSLFLGGAGGLYLGLLMSGVLITAGYERRRTIHALKGAAATGVLTTILMWLWMFLSACASC